MRIACALAYTEPAYIGPIIEEENLHLYGQEWQLPDGRDVILSSSLESLRAHGQIDFSINVSERIGKDPDGQPLTEVKTYIVEYDTEDKEPDSLVTSAYSTLETAEQQDVEQRAVAELQIDPEARQATLDAIPEIMAKSRAKRDEFDNIVSAQSISKEEYLVLRAMFRAIARRDDG